MCVDKDEPQKMAADAQERAVDTFNKQYVGKDSYYRPRQGPLGYVGSGIAQYDPTRETAAEATTRGQKTRLGTNPKDLLGAKKVSISKLPFIGVIHGAHAMMDGARKYGPYNWRSNKVVAGIYIDALVRHAAAWFDGEELAPDSGVNHLGHVIACAAILLDAEETGNLVDDRPIAGATGAVLDRLNGKIKQREEDRTAQEISETYGKSRY